MNICNFNTAPPAPDSIYTLNFVFETEEKNMSRICTDTAHRIYLVTDGSGILNTAYGNFYVKSGDIFFTFAADEYSISAIRELRYMYISFLGLRASLLFKKLNITKKDRVIAGCEKVKKVWEEFIGQAEAGNTDLISESALLYAFSVIELKRLMCDAESPYIEKMQLIKKYIEDNYSDVNITAEKISEKFSYSKKYLCELFKKEFGISVSRYITVLRIQKACSLMKESDYTVKQISKYCGFSDSLYFSKVFKKQVGVTPKDFMKQYLRPM